jgi:hypothetical protein
MSEVSNQDNNVTKDDEPKTISEKRLLWFMAIVSVVEIVGSLFLGNWRITFGLMLGSALSFLNYYWLKISLRSLFDRATAGERPRFTGFLYVLRYGALALTIALASQLKLITIAAALIGLLTFAIAILIEAFIQVFISIVNREEN